MPASQTPPPPCSDNVFFLMASLIYILTFVITLTDVSTIVVCNILPQRYIFFKRYDFITPLEILGYQYLTQCSDDFFAPSVYNL